MTLPDDPTLFLAHCKEHKTPTQSQPCKELKMPTHSPATPADEYLSSVAMHFSNISLLDTMPTHHQSDGILLYGHIFNTSTVNLLTTITPPKAKSKDCKCKPFQSPLKTLCLLIKSYIFINQIPANEKNLFYFIDNFNNSFRLQIEFQQIQ